ncbi:MAG: hypothetical protein AAF847_04690 [Bacteroidota bacterium]
MNDLFRAKMQRLAIEITELIRRAVKGGQSVRKQVLKSFVGMQGVILIRIPVVWSDQ